MVQQDERGVVCLACLVSGWILTTACPPPTAHGCYQYPSILCDACSAGVSSLGIEAMVMWSPDIELSTDEIFLNLPASKSPSILLLFNSSSFNLCCRLHSWDSETPQWCQSKNLKMQYFSKLEINNKCVSGSCILKSLFGRKEHDIIMMVASRFGFFCSPT